MEDALTIFQASFDGSSTELLVVGGLGLGLAAIRWGTPYLKSFFRLVAR